jgi:hypothetical protein
MVENLNTPEVDQNINPRFSKKKKDLSKITNYMTLCTEDEMTIFILPDPDYT